MERKNREWPDGAEGLRLVRGFLSLPPEKRQLVLEYLEQLSREQDRPEEETKASRP
jgi:hypothetical protein